ncbi:unnamed protein product, partial [Polarella glacialis]
TQCESKSQNRRTPASIRWSKTRSPPSSKCRSSRRQSAPWTLTSTSQLQMTCRSPCRLAMPLSMASSHRQSPQFQAYLLKRLLVNVLLAALQLSWTAATLSSMAGVIQNIIASPPTAGTAEAMAAIVKNITASAATIGTGEAMEPSSATLGTDEAMEGTSPGTISSIANRATESNESSSSAMANETVIQTPSQPWGDWLQSNLEAGVSNDTATKLRDLTRPQFWAAALRTRLWSVVQPVLSQILLSVLQLLGGLLLTRAPVVCSVGNKAIAQLEGKLSSRLNQQTHEVADKVFGQTFGAVKERSDSFFPKFKKRTEQLLTVMQSALKANAVAGQLGSLLGRGSSGASGGA